MFPDFLQRRSRRGYRCGLLPPLLLLLLAPQLPVADAQECSIDNQQAITTKCGGASLGVCCYPMENTPSGLCARGCGYVGEPACGSGCSSSDATTGVMPYLGQVCCLPPPTPTPKPKPTAGCTGDSTLLPAVQCAAWQAFWDDAFGAGWTSPQGCWTAASCKTDPCAASCNNGGGCNIASTTVTSMYVHAPAAPPLCATSPTRPLF